MNALVVPPAGPRSLRAVSGAGEAEAPSVRRVNPADGAVGVFRDAPVIVSLSHPVDPDSLTPEAFRVETSDGAVVDGRLTASPDGAVLIWTAASDLIAGAVHFVALTGLRDRRGMAFATHVSRFVPCDLNLADLFLLDR
ncbi:MAG: Ig-like domain-containing protein [Vicinamibacteria bacterium]